MNHIKLMTIGEPAVCESPALLGRVIVKVDHSRDEANCPDCVQLVMEHKEKEFERERRYDLFITLPEREKDDRLSASRGCVTGFAFATGFWITVALMVWAVYFRA